MLGRKSRHLAAVDPLIRQELPGDQHQEVEKEDEEVQEETRVEACHQGPTTSRCPLGSSPRHSCRCRRGREASPLDEVAAYAARSRRPKCNNKRYTRRRHANALAAASVHARHPEVERS